MNIQLTQPLTPQQLITVVDQKYLEKVRFFSNQGLSASAIYQVLDQLSNIYKQSLDSSDDSSDININDCVRLHNVLGRLLYYKLPEHLTQYFLPMPLSENSSSTWGHEMKPAFSVRSFEGNFEIVPGERVLHAFKILNIANSKDDMLNKTGYVNGKLYTVETWEQYGGEASSAVRFTASPYGW